MPMSTPVRFTRGSLERRRQPIGGSIDHGTVSLLGPLRRGDTRRCDPWPARFHSCHAVVKERLSPSRRGFEGFILQIARLCPYRRNPRPPQLINSTQPLGQEVPTRNGLGRHRNQFEPISGVEPAAKCRIARRVDLSTSLRMSRGTMHRHSK